MHTLQIGKVQLQLLGNEERFLGIGEVRVGETLLRNGQRPMFVDIRNPWGIHLRDYRLKQCARVGDGYALTFSLSREDGGPMDWQLHECRPLRNVADWSMDTYPLAAAELTLTLQPVTRTLGDRVFHGFCYQYSYRSADIPIYMLLDRATWELEGSALASELWLRQTCAPPIYRPRALDEHYSTEWYLAGCTNSNIFQFLPLQTQLQGFTMTAGEAGMLLTWSPKVYHLRTLIEKPRDVDLFVHLHEHCADLTTDFTGAPMEVLFAPGDSGWVERANMHGEMMELVYTTLHNEIGFRREYIPSYGQIEEWTDADLDLYRREGLPALAEAGITCIDLANHFQNDMNTWGLSNMCCNVDYKVAETVGEDKLQAFCRDAAQRGVRVFMWGNTAISSTTLRFAEKNGVPKRIDHLPFDGSIMQVLQQSRRPFVINSHGAIEADHYSPRFCVLNLRDPVVRDYWLTSWRYLNEHIGVTGIFLDSSFNMSSDKFDWRFNAELDSLNGATIDQADLLGHMRPAQTPLSSVESQYCAHLELMREMQQQGYCYCGEDCGVFGLHRSGPSLLTRLDNLPMWREFVTPFDVLALRQAGADPQEIFFRGLAYRLMWTLFWNVPSRQLTFHWGGARNAEDLPAAWHVALYHAYNKVEEDMRHHRLILPEEQGVLYTNGSHRVLWSLTDGKLPLGKVHVVRNVLTDEVWETDELVFGKQQIYLLTLGDVLK